MLHLRSTGPLLLLSAALLAFPHAASAGCPCSDRVLASNPDPEAVVWAFRDAFVHQDLEAYAALLADDYVFRFRPDDVEPGMPDTLNRAGELDFARHLFQGGAASGAPPAEHISLRIEILGRQAEMRAGGIRWAKFALMTHLRAYLKGGGLYQVDSPVTFLVRREGAEAGTWRLVEWVELTPAATPEFAGRP